MQASIWREVFASFRPQDVDDLIIALSSGLEVAVSSIAKIEESLVLIRGRASGAEIGGRLFLIPYAGIAVVYVNRIVRPIEVDLYAPSVDMARKDEISDELERQAEEERTLAANAEKEVADGRIDPAELKRQLEELRAASFGRPEDPSRKDVDPPPRKSEGETVVPDATEAPPALAPAKPSIPAGTKFNLPKGPRKLGPKT